MSRLVALVILLLLAPVCVVAVGTAVVIDQDNNFIVNGRPLFPLGVNPGPVSTLLWRDGTSGYAELARGGINFFRTSHNGSTWTLEDEARFVAQMDQAEIYGLYGYVSLRDLTVPLPTYPNREIELRRVISTYKNRPVLFWKSADEPAWGGVSIPGLVTGYQIIKELDPDHPVLMNHAPRNTIEELRAYCVAADVTGADIYPVSVPMGKHSGLPNKEMSVVGDYTLRMREVVYDQKPIVMVLQITWSGVLPPNNVLVRPTFYQQRYMTYQAIICGAKGLAWFGSNLALSEEDTPYAWNWTYWVDVLKPLLMEIAAGSELNRVITAPSHDMLLGVTGAGDVEYLARELDGRVYLLASRRESPTATVTFAGLPKTGKAEALFENRTIDIVNGTLTDSFDPNAVHVYRLFEPWMTSSFDQDTVEDPAGGSYPLPQGWNISGTLTNPDKCGVVESGAEFAPEPADPTLARCVKFHDPANSTGNAQLYREFPAATTGTVTAQFDVRLRQTNSAFLCRLCNDGSVSDYGSFAAHIVFEGATPWATDGAPGVVSYQVERNSARFVNSGAKYEANKWYTVRIEANLDAAKFRIYFGARGKPLKEITPYGGQPFIKPPTGEHVTSVQKICFATSSLGTDPDGVDYIDNVRIEGPVQTSEQSNDVSRGRMVGKGSPVRLDNAIVTAGTDQMGGSFFYVQDDVPGGAGLRVRVSGVTVHEGDRVGVIGTLQQASDNGILVYNNGEREILASQVTVLTSGNATPPPVFMRASDAGGGHLGEMEYIDSTRGSWPRLKGVWPYSQCGNGNLAWDPLVNRYSPLFNVGTLVTVTGRVTKMCKQFPAGHSDNDIYVDDGSVVHDGWYDPAAYGDNESNHPRGVRIRMPSDILTLPGYGDITGAYVSVTGIAGAISSSNITSNTGVRNVALVRPRVVTRDVKIIAPVLQ